MSWMYRNLVRPILFTQDSEEIHNRTLRMLARASRNRLLSDMLGTFCESPNLPMELFGLRFPNPVGLAAGMDKCAEALPVWQSLGFGFTELGGITWHAQPGNDLPRVFRAIPDEALVNRMGFNNPGAEAFASTLAQWRVENRWPKNHPIGINLGKSKITPLEKAAEDYARSFRALQPHADFFVVNVSSPNTPGLRHLQDKTALDEILAAIQETQHSTLKTQNLPKPILVKVSPDLTLTALDEILELVKPRSLAGIVATNTTITRPDATNNQLREIYAEQGGLSGKPLRARSTEVIRHLYRQTRGTVPIIGVGGIMNAADAWEKTVAGASLIQIYTGLVYEGPGIARQIACGLRNRLEEHGWNDLRQAVGSEHS